MTSALVLIAMGAAGLIVGSFLNVCIHRLPRRESVVSPASHCPACGRPLEWPENIPVASWLATGGRCRTCRARIPLMYPIVEILTAVIFVAGTWMFGLTPLLVVRLAFSAALIVLAAIDLRHRLLPNAITLPGIVAGFLVSWFLPPGWQSSLVGVLLGGGFLFTVGELYYRMRGQEGLGMGDVKMLAMIGAFLGWPLMILTLILASIGGSLVGLGLIVTRRGGMQAELPFGAFLAVGALISGVAGDGIVAWYLSFY